MIRLVKTVWKNIQRSIQKELLLTFLLLFSLFMIFTWGVNQFFLEGYYLREKTKVIKEARESIEKISDFRESTEDRLRVFCSKDNLSMVVTTPEGVILYVGGTEKHLEATLFGYFTQEESRNADVIEKTDSYLIQKHKDRFAEMYYLEMWGVLDNGNCFIIRSPLETISDSVAISNRFFAWVGCLALAVFSLIVWFVSKRFSAPLVELTKLSKRMANLDFEVKYTSGGSNEIGQLGRNFNQMSKELESAICELKVANVELKKDIKQKIQIDEMRKEFLANVSHELKTPIALIQGYAEGLKENISDNPQDKDFYCDVIIDEAAKMNQMVKKLLTLNQLEFGNDQVHMERFNITELVRGILQSSQILAEQKEANIHFCQQEDIYVWGDEFKIEEVVTNYLTNAFNHLDGERVIDIKIAKEESKVRVSVFNTGNPIPEEDIDKIWIKFYKVDKARTRTYGGNGIGLSIVKAIMESMKEECGVNNYENGVEFWFTLERK